MELSMMSKQVTKKSFLSGSPSRVDIRYKNLYIDSQKKVLVTCDLVKHLLFVYISFFVISFSSLMFFLVLFFFPHMQVESLTEENKQLAMKLETAICKVEAVCLSDPLYITFFVSWLVNYIALSYCCKNCCTVASHWCTYSVVNISLNQQPVTITR